MCFEYPSYREEKNWWSTSCTEGQAAKYQNPSTIHNRINTFLPKRPERPIRWM